MTTKVLGGIVAVILGIVMLCAIGGAALFGGGSSGCTLPVPSGGPALTAPAGGWPPAGSYTSDQVGLAATIVSVGAQMGVPVRGWVIAVATAIQESDLSNPAGGDQDSIGLFQRRPSQGWGTPDQLHDPVYASGKFYAKLLTIPNWQQMALTDAAQAVQRSAYPDAYAKHEPDATMLVNTLGSGTFWDSSAGPGGAGGVFACGGDGGDGQAGNDSVPLPASFALPPSTPPAVVAAIFWALAQLGTPYHLDGDCTAAHSGDPAHQCDCSSLIQVAYATAGISIPRSTRDQINAGSPVSDLSQILPGDLLFIPGSNGTVDHPGHVGMYIGDGLLVQAPHTGDFVKISKVSSWANEISIIRRIA